MNLSVANFNLRPAASDVLDELYAAAVEMHRLPQALSFFASLLGGEFACLIVKDFEAGEARTRIFEYSQGHCSSKAQEERILDSLSLHIRPGQEGVIGGRCPANGAVQRMDSLNPQPVFPMVNFIGLVVKGGPWISFALLALRKVQPFPDAARTELAGLQSDVRRALSLRQLVGRTNSNLDIRLNEDSEIAMLVVRNLLVERRNTAATSLLNCQGLISIQGGLLSFSDHCAQAALEVMSMPSVRDTRSHRSRTKALVLKHPDGGAWIVQMAQQDGVLEAEMSARPSSPAIAVALTPLCSASKTREAMLNGFTNLTPTERSILAAFVDGHCVSSIAASMNRSVETVRWHIRNLFEKLGVSTQAELARLGALLLPI